MRLNGWHQRGAKFWKKKSAPKTTSLKTLTNGSVPGHGPFGEKYRNLGFNPNGNQKKDLIVGQPALFCWFCGWKKHVTFKQIRTQMVGFFKKSDESHQIESMKNHQKTKR